MAMQIQPDLVAEFKDRNIKLLSDKMIKLTNKMVCKFYMPIGETRNICGDQEIKSRLKVVVRAGLFYRLYMKRNESFTLICRKAELSEQQTQQAQGAQIDLMAQLVQRLKRSQLSQEFASVVVYAVEGDAFSFGVTKGDNFQLIVPIGRKIRINDAPHSYKPLPLPTFSSSNPFIIIRCGETSRSIHVAENQPIADYYITCVGDESTQAFPGEIRVWIHHLTQRVERIVTEDREKFSLTKYHIYNLTVLPKKPRIITGSGAPPVIVNLEPGHIQHLIHANENENFIFQTYGATEGTALLRILCTHTISLFHVVYAKPGIDEIWYIQGKHKELRVIHQADRALNIALLKRTEVLLYPGQTTNLNVLQGNRYVVKLDGAVAYEDRIVNPAMVRLITPITDKQSATKTARTSGSMSPEHGIEPPTRKLKT